MALTPALLSVHTQALSNRIQIQFQMPPEHNIYGAS